MQRSREGSLTFTLPEETATWPVLPPALAWFSPEGAQRKSLAQWSWVTPGSVWRVNRLLKSCGAEPKQSHTQQGKENNAKQASASEKCGRLLRSDHIRPGIRAARSLKAQSHNLPSSHLQCSKLFWEGDFYILPVSMAEFTNVWLIVATWSIIWISKDNREIFTSSLVLAPLLWRRKTVHRVVYGIWNRAGCYYRFFSINMRESYNFTQSIFGNLFFMIYSK